MTAAEIAEQWRRVAEQARAIEGICRLYEPKRVRLERMSVALVTLVLECHRIADEVSREKAL